MCLVFYLFFAGLILLYTVVHDLWRIGDGLKKLPHVDHQQELNEAGLTVMRGVFRCTILGVLVAIWMKVQSSYLASSGENIVTWLVGDMSSLFQGRNDVSTGFAIVCRRITAAFLSLFRPILYFCMAPSD
ncbi:hypothetical protein X756_31210 [Mesorhizobium sp. LSHC412B00]|nr:hypothetical protein X756_31210 [Mesorhizobium sp. LSHC412B00]